MLVFVNIEHVIRLDPPISCVTGDRHAETLHGIVTEVTSKIR